MEYLPKSADLRGLNICKGAKMDDRKDLSEILLGDKRNSSSGKKAVFVVIIAVVVFVVVASMVWRFFMSNQEQISKPSATIDTSTMKPFDPLSDNIGDEFVKLDDPQTLNISQLDMNFGIDDGLSSQKDADDSEIDDALNNIENIIGMKPAQNPKPEPKIEPQLESRESKPEPKQTATKPAESKPKEPKIEPKLEPKRTEPKKVESKPQSSVAKNPPRESKPQSQATSQSNQSTITKGFYWQVGSFSKAPNAEFLALIKKYPYKIQNIKRDSVSVTRYLLGPYRSRSEAPSKDEIMDIFKENPTPIEIQ